MATTAKKNTKNITPNSMEETTPIVETEQVVEAPVKKPAARPVASTVKKYEPDELIPCRSLTVGTLLMVGRKTKARYEWSGYDDVQYVEYQDLMSEMLTNSKYIYKPRFIIEDDYLLSDLKWKRIKDLYNTIYEAEDLTELLELPYARFAATFPNLPEGMKQAVKTKVSTLVSEGNFDSIKKVRLIDEICGTDIACLLV